MLSYLLCQTIANGLQHVLVMGKNQKLAAALQQVKYVVPEKQIDTH